MIFFPLNFWQIMTVITFIKHMNNIANLFIIVLLYNAMHADYLPLVRVYTEEV